MDIGQRVGAVQWGDLVMGPGTRYHVTSLEGYDDLPEVRAEDMPKEGADGDYTGPDFVGPRVVQLGLTLHGDSPDELRALTVALRAACQPCRTPAPLMFTTWGTLLWAKLRRRAVPYDAEHLWSSGSAALEFYCADPRIHSLEEHSATTTAYSPAAGRTYPLTYPRTYGSAGESGRVSATNAGDTTAYPLLRIDGPVSRPSVEGVNTDTSLVLDVTLQAGEFVVIDTRSRAVLYMGSTPRRQWVRNGSSWPYLAPGPNELAYRSEAIPGGPDQPSLLTVTWRDASL
ncbi:hypothetical protein AQ490_23190 [Wenjunlia vitaminophila]|uniref:Siphovirus-type tail component C-terminal domain-containing protein n=1 Tax=Wenjunlia vitaminophila TaxID=76728 RepID=A0A0T6LRP1_WENVI|nr:phage tail domain-containing protein [Wenjunlia vitaminophila]KRV48779.1 hypothetical protein AQ490_23190 [Wenjunlia vitaminophila]